MKKNKQELLERHIYLEEWLKNNYPNNMTDNEILSYFMTNYTNKHDVLYLIEAYFLPKDEIENYKKNNFMSDIDAYRELSIRYGVSVDCIVRRINEIKLMKEEYNSNLYRSELEYIKELDKEFDCFGINKVFKYIKLELLADTIVINRLSQKEILKEIKKYNLDKEDTKYLNRAIYMPRIEILNESLKHDSDNYDDYMKFINALAVKYNTNSYDILDRIEEVSLFDYLKNELENEIKKKEKIKNSCIK